MIILKGLAIQTVELAALTPEVARALTLALMLMHRALSILA
jgi:hypothetical protein